jgi:hypothetical protein
MKRTFAWFGLMVLAASAIHGIGAEVQTRLHVGDWIGSTLARIERERCIVLPRLSGLAMHDRAIVFRENPRGDILECFIAFFGTQASLCRLEPPVTQTSVRIDSSAARSQSLTDNTISLDRNSQFYGVLYRQFQAGKPDFPQARILADLVRHLPRQPRRAFASATIAFAEVPAESGNDKHVPSMTIVQLSGGTTKTVSLAAVEPKLFDILQAQPAFLDAIGRRAGNLASVNALAASGAFVVGSQLYPANSTATARQLLDLTGFTARLQLANAQVTLDGTPEDMAKTHARLQLLSALSFGAIQHELADLGLSQHPLLYLTVP